jgi:hypothetical protein
MKTKWLPGRILTDGYVYCGIAYDENRKQFYRLAVSPKDLGEMTWYQAMEKFGNELPTRKECGLIIALPMSTFSWWRYYWSSTEYNSNIADIQRFSDGYQTANLKSSTYLVRCVRRFGYT